MWTWIWIGIGAYCSALVAVLLILGAWNGWHNPP